MYDVIWTFVVIILQYSMQIYQIMCYTPETNMLLYVSYTSIKSNPQKRWSLHRFALLKKSADFLKTRIIFFCINYRAQFLTHTEKWNIFEWVKKKDNYDDFELLDRMGLWVPSSYDVWKLFLQFGNVKKLNGRNLQFLACEIKGRKGRSSWERFPKASSAEIVRGECVDYCILCLLFFSHVHIPSLHTRKAEAFDCWTEWIKDL